jgi:hypothetical protein
MRRSSTGTARDDGRWRFFMRKRATPDAVQIRDTCYALKRRDTTARSRIAAACSRVLQCVMSGCLRANAYGTGVHIAKRVALLYVLSQP